MGRFSFSFPGNRGRDDAWFRVGAVDVTTTILVVGLAVLSLLGWAITGTVDEPPYGRMGRLILFPNEVLKGQVWRVVTWPLYNVPDIWVVIGIAIFYFFGRELERLMGRNRMAWFVAILTVFPGLVAVLLDLPAAGMRHIQLACFLGYVLLYPQARSFFNIPLWVLGAVFIGIDVLQYVGNRDGRGLVFFFVVCLTAVAMLSFYGLTSHLSWMPNLSRVGGGRRGGGRSRGGPRGKRSKPSRKRNLRAVPDPPADVYRPPTPRPGDGLRQAEIDMLLDKIAAEGIDSLTPEERRRLDEASRRLRDERG